MTCLLIGNGYWGKIVNSKLINYYDVVITANSKSNITEIINSSNLDIAYVCTPTITHYDIVKTLILKKVNVFCEKPFTGNYLKALELFELSKKNNVKLYIDNIFLFRNEFFSLKKLKFKTIKFIWNKFDNTKNESIIDSLLYHDLYILFNLTNDDWSVIHFEYGEDNLFLKLNQCNKNAEFKYDRNFIGNKEKIITVDGVNFDFSSPKNDPLSETILNITKNNINYEFNNLTTLTVLKFIDLLYEK